MFLLISVKFAAILHEIKLLKNSRWWPKRRACCETIATVLNKNSIVVMESK